ncbi:hypothetical protein EX30DRAFT_337068 [Ascodesmis nigricans]|uniref:Succinate dehydrogenase [ubiquinone] cytochrome b small subunit n=1 Tax=Ascodesmis nigricans TaxID=341454 RepID=A0A4V3SJM2_9PEZI|nr:hypothetical protein EX30DRAFT_337068 [Ascodesmis nigricans]
MSFIRPTLLRPVVAPRFVAAPRTAIAAFHATPKHNIMPAGPQVIDGTINDPAPVPEQNSKHGAYHWSFERLLSVGLIPLTIAPFAAGSVHPVLDATLGATLVLHSHIGFQACIADYFPMRNWPTLHKGSKILLNIGTAIVLYGLYEFETNDVGITEAVKRVWTA